MKTRLTAMFGIKHPIMLAGMNLVTEPKLVAAVSNAGCLGVLAISSFMPHETQQYIEDIRKLTDKPFGVNLVMIRPNAQENLKVVVDAKVPVVNYSMGTPAVVSPLVKAVHGYGGKVIATVVSVKHALSAERLGADALSVTGNEASAHGAQGTATAITLLPIMAQSVKIPFFSAGGYFNGRGLAAALVLGADGISMGNRFIMTKESRVADATKQALLKASESDIFTSDKFDGQLGTVLKSPGSVKMSKASGLTILSDMSAAMHIRKMLGLSWPQFIKTGIMAARGKNGTSLLQQMKMARGVTRLEMGIKGDLEHGFIWSGQSQGGINEIPTVAEVVDRIIAEAEAVILTTAKNIQ